MPLVALSIFYLLGLLIYSKIVYYFNDTMKTPCIVVSWFLCR